MSTSKILIEVAADLEPMFLVPRDTVQPDSRTGSNLAEYDVQHVMVPCVLHFVDASHWYRMMMLSCHSPAG